MRERGQGALGYILDDTFRTQFRVTSHYEAVAMDVGGTRTTCRAAYRTEDLNGDGHADVGVRAHCVVESEDEESGRGSRRRNHVERECLWSAATDTFECDPIGRWLWSSGAELGGHGSPGNLAETPEQLAATLHGLGERVPEILRQAAAGAAPTAGSAPAPVIPDRDCRAVVEDSTPLRVRTAPNAQSDVVGELPNGTRITLGQRRGRWARVDAPHAGWVWTASVREPCLR